MGKVLEMEKALTCKLSMKEIAETAEVSVATVSRIINKKPGVSEKTRKNVENIIKKFNYHPNELARSFAKGKTHLISLIIPTLTNPAYPEIAKGADDYARAHGYHIIISNTNNNLKIENELLVAMLRRRVDGIILGTIETSDRGLKKKINEILDFGIPIMIHGREIKDDRIDIVKTDSKDGARKATEHLISLGHNRIGFIGGGQGSLGAKERQAGYEETLLNHSIPIDEKLIFEGDSTQFSGYRGMECFLGLSYPPTAVFAINDLTAMGAMFSLEEKGITVPQKIAIVGFDDIPLASMVKPRLTTIVTPRYEIGYTLCKLLIERMNNKTIKGRRIVFETRLVIRESTIAKITSPNSAVALEAGEVR